MATPGTTPPPPPSPPRREPLDPPEPPLEREPLNERDLLRASPTLARLAMGAWWRTAQWSLATSVRTSTRMLRAAAAGESPAEVLSDMGSEAREQVRRFLGLGPAGEGGENPVDDAASVRAADSLRERGAELLRRSADVSDDEDAHPAYELIVEQLHPDEARILRLLALEGPQPSVDVRGAKGLPVTTQLVAPGLSMIGPQAGCRHLDRVPAYLNNLFRLGLIWFSREPLEDPLRYQVVEAQPDVISALARAGRARKTVRRSIHLTPFGEDFCATVLPLGTAEIDALATSPPAAAVRREPPRPA